MSECPKCGGRLARGGARLSCTECEWGESIMDTAERLGLADE